MHNLLALAGAGDRATIEAWAYRVHPLRSGAQRTVRVFAPAMLAYVDGAMATCADGLDTGIGSLNEVGDSGAQNGLFHMLRDWCRMESGTAPANLRIAA